MVQMSAKEISLSLALPLSAAQVEAAGKLYQSFPAWRLADDALSELRGRFPSFDETSVLLKTVAVNTLYSTNVFAVQKMAQHIVAVLAKTDLVAAGTELVENIATLGSRKHISFASKFSNIFIDGERFPMSDSYAIEMAERHLGKANAVDDRDHPYIAFLQNLSGLRRLAGLGCDNRDLDRYLWIAGQYHAFKRDPERKINTEARRLFSSPNADEERLLKVLAP